ncbi:MAG: aspartate--ammonia ligase [Christensenella sp.]|nr:aspartate--ammonia ligase [Christensenella sp.]
MALIIPEEYDSKLNIRETEKAIRITRDLFTQLLSDKFNLERASAPLFVKSGTGINDDLNGIERAVSFDILSMKNVEAQIVHSLAKWKRLALYNYGYKVGEGIYTNMNAIRRDENPDNLHSFYVDQWDWEKVISREDRNIDFLKKTVNNIVGLICDLKDKLNTLYPVLNKTIKREVTFITAQELEDLYPDKTPKEREEIFVKEHKTVFLMQIGDVLKSGEPHDGRAPDYDDWSLNGDILFYNEILDCAFEVSSMGIRVDEKALREQLAKSEHEDRLVLPFHKMILNNTLPLTIGGGIGQSRLCMLILEKAHIGEVHSSIWPDDMINKCKSSGINLL